VQFDIQYITCRFGRHDVNEVSDMILVSACLALVYNAGPVLEKREDVEYAAFTVHISMVKKS
jgi:hypothetical protein